VQTDTADTATPDGFVHGGFFYRDAADYLAGTVPFVLDGLNAGEAVAVAVPGPNLARIADALGPAAGGVLLLDMTEAGRNPGRIIGSVLTRFIDTHPGQRARILDEPIWVGRRPDEYPACVQHEALVNVAFADREATILCPYDAGHLDPVALLDATRTHPILVEGDHCRTSEEYADPVHLAARYDTPLDPPAGEPDVMVFDARIGTRGVRRFVHEYAERAGLPPNRLRDLRAAVHEVTLNTLVHTERPGILSVWTEEGYLVCEVQDSGAITDPLAGRRAPAPYDDFSGLFLVHALCDLVRTHLTGYGTTVRMYFRQ
jgi:anti-sigma regulatory factor (Ser/Thr protein kinase)